MPLAVWIEGCAAAGTFAAARKVIFDRKFRAAGSAQDGKLLITFDRPRRRLVIGNSGMTIETRIILSAAPELDRDYVELGMPMLASRLSIDINTSHDFAILRLCVHLSSLI
jgi:hypothetical protein